MKKDFGKRVMFILTGSLLLWGMNPHTRIANAANHEKKVYVYHRHVGSEETQGGCYTEPVFHEHIGEEENGSGCYSEAVYHEHDGDKSQGGNCYTIPVMHAHSGDAQHGGGCYKAVFHQHSGDCYRKVSSEEYGCYILDWWDTTDNDWRDGDGYLHDYRYYEMSCGQTIHGTNSGHYHSEMNCGRGGEITGYTLGCGKNEDTVDGYELSCEKTEETIEGYVLGCQKSSQDIDSYAIACGKDEEMPYGVMTVTVSDIGNQKAVLQAGFEDLTGGELNASESEYIWYDSLGNEINRGSQMTVSENGTYMVTMQLDAETMTPEQLTADVSVDCIMKPTVKEEHKPSDETDSEEEEIKDSILTPTPIPTPVPTPIPTPIPTPVVTPTPLLQEPTPDAVEIRGQESMLSTDKERYVIEAEVKEESTPTPTPQPTAKKTVVVKTDRKQSKPEEISKLQIEEVKETHFFDTPAVKVISFTLGIILGVLLLLLAVYVLLRSVAVYNDDGNGNLLYLGRSLVFREEEGWIIVISEKMREKATTNKYCIKPDLFLLGKGEQEVIVECAEKRCGVMLSREMNVII